MNPTHAPRLAGSPSPTPPSVRLRLGSVAAALCLATTCLAQLTWAPRRPLDASSNAFLRFTSIGAAFDESRGRHLFFRSDYNPLGANRVLVFGFDGDTWTTSLIPNATFGEGAALSEDPIGAGRILLGGSVTGGPWRRWNPSTRNLENLNPPFGEPRGYGVFTNVPGIGAVLFGGQGFFGLPSNDVWVWDGATWRNATSSPRPSARIESGASRGGSQQPLLLFGGSFQSDTWSFNGSAWTQHAPATVPPNRSRHGMAYDPLRGRVVMFGGIGPGGLLNDTWEWDGLDWRRIMAPQSPSPRKPVSMNWDPIRRTIVLIGAVTDAATEPVNPIDTWTWNGTTWTQLNTSPDGYQAPLVPAARAGASVGHDHVRGKTIVFGGRDAAGAALGDTWESDGRLWAQRFPGLAPPARQHAATAVLRSTGAIGVLGGFDNWGSVNDDLWLGAGTSWRQLPLAGAATPGERFGAGMGCLQEPGGAWAFVLFGGTATATNTVLDDTFVVYPDGVCRKLAITGPDARTGAAMANANETTVGANTVFLFGGQDAFGGTSNDLWRLTVTSAGVYQWTRPTVNGTLPTERSGASLAWHSGLRRLFLFGGVTNSGSYLDDTWFLQGTQWVQIQGPGPSPRGYAGMVYDARLDRLVLHGGDEGQTLTDIWELDGNTWSQRLTPGKPQARREHALAYDRSTKKSLLFGGSDATLGELNDLWAFDGKLWSPVVGAGTAPAPRMGHVACYDESVQQTIVFGGVRGTTYYGDTALFDGATWSSGGAGPTGRADAALVYCSHIQRSVLFGGIENVVVGETWSFDATTRTWQRPSTTGAPSPRFKHAMAYDRMRQRIVMFGGNDGSGPIDETWELDVATWTWIARFPATRPPARTDVAMTYDEARARVVLIDSNPNAGGANDVWDWNGDNWELRGPETVGPTARGSAAACYDADRARIVYHGGVQGTVYHDELWELYAPWDKLGPGMLTSPSPRLDFHSQPILGMPLKLGFDNPRGLAVMAIGFGPVQRPPFVVPAPPMCGPAQSYTLLQIAPSVSSMATTNYTLSVPNNPQFKGLVLVFQAFALQAAGCLTATDGLQAHF